MENTMDTYRVVFNRFISPSYTCWREWLFFLERISHGGCASLSSFVISNTVKRFLLLQGLLIFDNSGQKEEEKLPKCFVSS